jgi:hypothetical protein
MRGRISRLLHASLAQVLDWAVRLCAVSQLVGLLELAIARRELLPGGFLDWTLIGVLNPKARTGTGSLIRKIFRRIGPRLFNWTLLIDGAVATLLLVRPSAAPLIAIAWIMQLLIMKRHHLTFDGSDHMTLVVLLACLLGRVESDPVAERAAVTFLAAEVSLAYLAAGLYKATSPYWQSGQAIPMVVQTRMFGRVAAARLVRQHPLTGLAATYAVFCWECLFVCFIAAPRPVLLVSLALGVGFHLSCSLIMGLNRFILVFVASYPAVIFVNGAVRATLGPSVSDFLTVGMVTLTGLALCAAFCRYRPGRSDSVADVRAAVRLTSLAQPPAEVRNAGETLTAEGLDQRVPLDGDAGRLR